MIPACCLVVTDRRQARRPLAEVVAAAIDGGARAVLLREKDLPRMERMALAVQLRALLAPVGGVLIVAGPDPLPGSGARAGSGSLPAAAVHLAATDPPASALFPSHQRGGDLTDDNHDEPGGVVLVGRSCHDAAEVGQLTVEDYLTVSPVFASSSKPDYGPALGPAGLAALCRQTERPVLALGGIETSARVAACIAAGAAGVAVMGVVMRAVDPAAVVNALVAATL